MKLSTFKSILPQLTDIRFILPDGSFVPEHFHITEVGLIEKHFIDCGGTVRKESVVNFQLWEANDYDHRLEPKKLLKIIEISEQVVGLQDLEVEVEYQQGTIGKFGLKFKNDNFILTNKQTDCLAKDNCGIPSEKEKVSLASIGKSEKEKENSSCCTPGDGCC